MHSSRIHCIQKLLPRNRSRKAEPDGGRPQWIACADIAACFYQCGIEARLSEYFCLSPVTANEALSFGLARFPDGGVLQPGGDVVHIALAR